MVNLCPSPAVNSLFSIVPFRAKNISEKTRESYNMSVDHAPEHWYCRWSLARLGAWEWCRKNNGDDEENRGEVELHVTAVVRKWPRGRLWS